MNGVITVEGGVALQGSVRIEGAKNACLPIIAAALLCREEVVLCDVPGLEDVLVMCRVLEALGAAVAYDAVKKELSINARTLQSIEAPASLVHKMRASFLVVGPMLAREGCVKISLPGGCAIGIRPIDLHLKGLKALGAEVTIGHGLIEVAAQKLYGCTVYLDFPSVGATENIIMAASLAEGVTVIENAAREPEVVDLARFINAMGGRVSGAGTDTVRVKGVASLSGDRYAVIPDRIEAGTYLLAAAIAGGSVYVENVIPAHLVPLLAKLREAGCEIREMNDALHIRRNKPLRAIDIKTLPYPGFPSDLQSPVMALLTLAEGTSVITETVFENRFRHVDELRRMGAQIKIEGHTAIIAGSKKIYGAPVAATDLRAGAALVVAGLAATGSTVVSGVHHIDRGYLQLVEKLRGLGAGISRA
jgi:UDP-N-acetylglucosamine 1-carboxyvinyltransferase